ncbi:cytochrome O ubiquinol oxidase [Methylobacterium variabile]|uniref:Cytochrome bo(3) ubiquinol oxidase subunit 4 n=1 Tax=Methylobacterium variabile TaxID=298794 RepID=A0A0J6VQT6_9HYPH|nr:MULTISPECIES: cytochrome o ubiquinol oxidase subunit IV [Methylobacterium]KMO41571.1 cytochrome O ubiquinol oxidase [Methylobacterium variabile]NGM37329.1 cytochrome o ubiquinol oxidase subunit IV [Methylobacterium sp. DB0501]UHC20315.1 cytochrome o ubiquinol oxidase subunit IV [Methylobacterium currus]
MSTHSLHVASDGNRGHGRRSYWTGCALAVILTVIPFWLVMARPLHDPGWTAAIIFALALVQIVVHVVSFLHLDTQSEEGWTLLAFLFTAVIVILTIGGSVWVMYHLNTNMMPMP